MAEWLVSLRQAGENATPGPWEVSPEKPELDEIYTYLLGVGPPLKPQQREWDREALLWVATDDERNADAALIVLARNRWPLIVDVIEAAEAFLAVPRKVERDEETGALIADFTPQQEARERLAAALASLRAAVGDGA